MYNLDRGDYGCTELKMPRTRKVWLNCGASAQQFTEQLTPEAPKAIPITRTPTALTSSKMAALSSRDNLPEARVNGD